MYDFCLSNFYFDAKITYNLILICLLYLHKACFLKCNPLLYFLTTLTHNLHYYILTYIPKTTKIIIKSKLRYKKLFCVTYLQYICTLLLNYRNTYKINFTNILIMISRHNFTILITAISYKITQCTKNNILIKILKCEHTLVILIYKALKQCPFFTFKIR